MKSLFDAVNNIQDFTQDSLRHRIIELERRFSNLSNLESFDLASELKIDGNLFESTLVLKGLAGQINEIVHAVGIVTLLPHILSDNEVIKSLSLAAGNTGRPFDLETNFRIAEFKFIQWREKADSMRQNNLFKDFYSLAEFDTQKQRFLYVVGSRMPLKFMNSNRAIQSILSTNTKLKQAFDLKYGDSFATVQEYFNFRKNLVTIEDISVFLPNF
jgi:hypothetical protein